MKIIPRCEKCGESVAPFAKVCDKCVAKETRTSAAKKAEECALAAAVASASVSHPTAKLLAKHVGETVGVNFNEPGVIRTAILAGVTDTYFTIREKELSIHYPFETIVYVAESPTGISAVAPGAFNRASVKLVIQVRSFITGSLTVGVGALLEK